MLKEKNKIKKKKNVEEKKEFDFYEDEYNEEIIKNNEKEFIYLYLKENEISIEINSIYHD